MMTNNFSVLYDYPNQSVALLARHTITRSRKLPECCLLTLSILSVFVFGGDELSVVFALLLYGCAQRVPGEAGAFDAGREFANAGEDFQAAQVVLLAFGVEIAFDHPVEFVKHHFGLFLRLAFDGGGHHRSRGLRDGAARSLEADVFDHVAFHQQIERDLIAAKRVVAFLLAVGCFKPLEAI